MKILSGCLLDIDQLFREKEYHNSLMKVDKTKWERYILHHQKPL